MDKHSEQSIKNMISSPDKENTYVAACILRSENLNLAESKRRKLLESISLPDKFKNYSDICEEIKQKELTLEDFAFLPEQIRKKVWARAILEQIAIAVNGKWKAKWEDYNQSKWYPYFEKKGSGLVFLLSDVLLHTYFGGLVAFKDEKTSDFVAHTYPEIYEILSD